MKHSKPRSLSLLLAVLIAFSLLPPVEAWAASGVAINKTNFPDPVFRLYVAKEFDNDGDGYLSKDEIGLGNDMWLWESNISSLKGIEYFTELSYLNCGNNKLKSLDVSKNTLLFHLDCSYNQLTSLNVTKNTKLTELYCSDNNLTSFNVTKNTELTDLDCGGNKLTSLNISKNKELGKLFCGGNPIRKLDIRNNPKLMQAVELGEKDYYNREYFIYENITYSISALGYTLSIHANTRLQTGSTEPPIVTKNPKDKSAVAGKRVTLSVTATGNGLKYQWYAWGSATDYKWKPVKGGTSPKLTVKVKKDTNTLYYCEITNSGGAVFSKEAKVTVATKPIILSQPSNKTVKAGKKVTFKVKASGGELKYQWYVMKAGTTKWAKLSGKTSTTLKLTAKKNMNGYKYRCQVKNIAGTVYSKAVKLTVK